MSFLKKICLTIVFIIILLNVKALAQDRETMLKLETGFINNISFRLMNESARGNEITFGLNREKYMFEYLQTFSMPAFPEDDNNWFLVRGFGFHVTYHTQYCLHNFLFNRKQYMVDAKYVTLGFDGYVGLEYYFAKQPFSFSVDWRPCFELLGPKHFELSLYTISMGFAYTI